MTEVLLMLQNLQQEVAILKTFIQSLLHKPSEPYKFDKIWIDSQDVMLSLHISKRTLQNLRDTGVLPYSRINGKFYYKIADIEIILNKNYTKRLPL
ncbi:helix-turn-helix domain-containing protein [uncultured Arcticibacterium sp.]|jgi:hypothetical protein|uniref:helix-turn-helix domain-containing protein n=1 Tax=uncultured Arcticibacterium sp. TaxID=2173042 RepID=UPI0030FCC224